jgi:MFS transporter, DHA1 family, inner membrane transport protein
MDQASEHRSGAFVAAMLGLGVLAPTTFQGMPGIVGEVARQWGFGEAALGVAVFAEICAMSAGALLTGLGLAGQPARRLLAVAALLGAVGNAFTPAAVGFGAFLALRSLAGLGAGALAAISMRYLSYTGQAERHLGWLVMGQTLWSAALLSLLLPALATAGGASAIYRSIAALFVAALGTAVLFDRREPLARRAGAGVAGTHPEAPRVQLRGTWLTLLALLALYGGVGVVWTFVEHIGTHAGLTAGFIAATLGAANLASVAVCLLLPRVAQGHALRGWAEAMIAACALSAAGLALPFGAVGFVAVVTLFVCSWVGSVVLLFATMPRYDGVGRHAALSPGFLGLGFGIGSSASGALIESAHLTAALFGAAAACVVALLLYAALRLGESSSPAPSGRLEHEA